MARAFSEGPGRPPRLLRAGSPAAGSPAAGLPAAVLSASVSNSSSLEDMASPAVPDVMPGPLRRIARRGLGGRLRDLGGRLCNDAQRFANPVFDLEGHVGVFLQVFPNIVLALADTCTAVAEPGACL